MDDGTLFERLIKLETRVEILQEQLKAYPTRQELSNWNAPTSGAHEPTSGAEGDSFHCPKITLSKLVGGKYKMECWLLLGNGELSKWPQLTYTGKDLDEVLSWMPAGQDLSMFEDLPSEVDVDWTVAFKWGRVTGKKDDDGNDTRYKDLVSITEREE